MRPKRAAQARRELMFHSSSFVSIRLPRRREGEQIRQQITKRTRVAPVLSMSNLFFHDGRRRQNIKTPNPSGDFRVIERWGRFL